MRCAGCAGPGALFILLKLNIIFCRLESPMFLKRVYIKNRQCMDLLAAH